MKGYLEQERTPTPDNPVEIKTQVIGKNLFETYEVNGKQYTDNLPKNAFISISKVQYIEYEQQKEEIERLNNIINGMEKFFKYAYDNEVKPLNDRKVSVWTICLDKLQELKGSDKE